MTSHFAKTVLSTAPVKVEDPKAGKTGLVRIATYANGVRAVVRIEKNAAAGGYSEQEGLPVKSQPVKDAAYYQLAKLLACDDLVPETVLKRSEKGHLLSYQQYVRALSLRDLEPSLATTEKNTPEWRAAAVRAMALVPARDWRRALLLGLVACDRDRHLKNLGVRVTLAGDRIAYRLVLWDNGVCLGRSFRKYRSVPHEFLFTTTVDLTQELAAIEHISEAEVQNVLQKHRVQPLSASHAAKRLTFVRRYPYRLPWRVFTQDPRFPDYRNFFFAGIDWRGQ